MKGKILQNDVQAYPVHKTHHVNLHCTTGSLALRYVISEPVACIEESRQVAAMPIALAGCCSTEGMLDHQPLHKLWGHLLKLGNT